MLLLLLAAAQAEPVPASVNAYPAAASLFERADAALYRAKELGKDRADIARAGELRPDPDDRRDQ